jgi:hypothetical protein
MALLLHGLWSALSVELEYALRIAGEERCFRRFPEIENIEP